MLRLGKEKFLSLKWMAKEILDNKEKLENHARQNNLRFVNISEGVEGADLKTIKGQGKV